MKLTRLVPTVIVIGFAAFLAFRGIGGRVRDAQPAPEPAPAPQEGPAEFPTLGPTPSAAPAPAPVPVPKAAEPADDADPAPGTPVKDGADVSLVVPYRKGTKSRYRVADATMQKELGSNALQVWQTVWDVSTEVVAGDGSGPARVRLTTDGFRFTTTDSMGRTLIVESKDKDNKLLNDIQYGRGLKPMLAVLGMPVEFAIGAGGDVTKVDGAESLNRAFADAVDALGAQQSRDLSDAPTTESLAQRWSEILFPPLGGGTLKAPAVRDGKFRTTYYERWSCVTSGKFRVTNDDADSFRVEFKGRPEMEELNRPARWPSAAGVHKVRVVASDDSFTAAWRFDRRTARLAWGALHAKFRVDVARDANGAATHFTEVERRIVTELLDK